MNEAFRLPLYRQIALVALGSLACAQRETTPVPCAAPERPNPALETAEPPPPISAPLPAFDQAHTLWNDVLKAHVKGDAFDYAALKQNRGELDKYLKQVRGVSPKSLEAWTDQQRFAFWLNVYNAYTIRKVVDEYPLDSIRDLDRALGLKSIFDREFIALEAHHPDGKDDELSLNDIEHGILRATFEDARLHAAINCASFSCPPLRGEAFVAERLDAQIEEQMRAFVADPKRNRFDHADGVLRLSEIFKWFSEDFERDAGSVRDYVLRFAPASEVDFAREAKIRYIDYDWSLNDISKDG